MNKKLITVALATVAALALTMPQASFAHAKKMKCYGVDMCKGKADCKNPEYVMKTAKQCKKMGGSTTAPAAGASSGMSSGMSGQQQQQQ